MREVAAAAGVSIGTVSNVLNNPELVAGSTRERVERAMLELGFVRNAWARHLREGRVSVAGAIVLDLTNPFFAAVARGIEDRLAADDCTLIVCSTNECVDRESGYLRVLQERGVRGILLTPLTSREDLLVEIGRLGTPVVLLDSPSRTSRLCSVWVDDVKGGELVATHLMSLGHRRIVFLNGPPTIAQCAARGLGARRAMASGGLDPARHLLEVTLPPISADGVDVVIERVLDLADRPTAIMCVSDLAALRVMRQLRRRGIDVPGDIAVTGYDDMPLAAELYTPLTSVRQPTYELGRVAAELLLAEATPGHRHEQMIFQPELIVRGSTAVHVRDQSAGGGGFRSGIDKVVNP